MLHFIDKLAGKWIDWRMRRTADVDPEYKELGIRRVQVTEEGVFEGTFITPAAAIIAEQMARMLNIADAENYVQFDFLPRLDRGLHMVRVTVSWASGELPAAKASRLEEELEGARAWSALWKRAAKEHWRLAKIEGKELDERMTELEERYDRFAELLQPFAFAFQNAKTPKGFFDECMAAHSALFRYYGKEAYLEMAENQVKEPGGVD